MVSVTCTSLWPERISQHHFFTLCDVTHPLSSCRIQLSEVDIYHRQVHVFIPSLALWSTLMLKAQSLPDSFENLRVEMKLCLWYPKHTLSCVWGTTAFHAIHNHTEKKLWCFTVTHVGYEKLSWVFQMAILLFFSHILNTWETLWVVCQIEGEVQFISTLKFLRSAVRECYPVP